MVSALAPPIDKPPLGVSIHECISLWTLNCLVFKTHEYLLLIKSSNQENETVTPNKEDF